MTDDPFVSEPWNRTDASPFVQIEAVTKTFGDYVAVNAVSLDIYQHEFFSLLGGSGCGKTTLLRMLAGLETPTGGRIVIDGQDMTRVPAFERPVNMMFQSYALFPHYNVFNNVAFGLRQDRVPKAELHDRVHEVLTLVELNDFARRKPDQLSGGQRQRVALARALVKRPKLLLLDEPLAALDKNLRERTQTELSRIQERVGITFIMVTHDQQEAMNLSSRIAVMRDGRFEQTGTPPEIYETPANRFVAGFVGSVNLFEAEVVGREGELLSVHVRALDFTVCALADPDPPGSGACWLAVRPEKLTIATGAPQGEGLNRLRGVIEEITYLGSHSVYRVRTASGASIEVRRIIDARETTRGLSWDDPVWVSWPYASAVVLRS